MQEENKKEIGQVGESYAQRYLEKRGFQILEKNFRCKFGEMDLIISKDNIIVFIEVKFRRSLIYGLPCEAINSYKIHHLRRLASYYMAKFQSQYPERAKEMEFRIDVIEVLEIQNQCYIRHIKNAI